MPKIKEKQCKEIKIRKLKLLSGKSKRACESGIAKIIRTIFNPIFV